MDYALQSYRYLISKDGVNNIIVSLVSALLLYLFAELFRVRLPNLPILLFWKQFSGDATIVASEIKTPFEPRMRSGKPPYLLPLGEVLALGELLHFFRMQCKVDPSIVSVSNEADFDTIKDKNILILGGPKYNIAASAFMQEVSDELFYQPKRLLHHTLVEAIDPQLKVFVGKNTDYPDFTYDFHENVQYGTVILRKDYYVSGKHVLVVAGLNNASTLASVIWILSRSFSFWLQVRRLHKGFQAIIKCQVIGQAKVSKIKGVFYEEFS